MLKQKLLKLYLFMDTLKCYFSRVFLFAQKFGRSLFTTPVVFYTRAYACVRTRGQARLVKLALFSLLMLLPLGVSTLRPMTANATASTYVNFQARLESSTGAIVPDGTYNIEFKLYNALTSSGSSQGSCTGDAACLWTETRQNSASNGVQVIDGYLSVNLGSVTAFPSTINWNQQLYLTMNIGGTSVGASPTYDGEMSPRLSLTAVPYSFQAGALQTVNGANVATLSFTTPTATDNILLPNAGGTVCLQNATACGFAAATLGTGYIQNGTGLQSAANFDIQSSASGSVGGVIEGASGQTADLLELKNSGGTVLSEFTAAGALQGGNGSGSNATGSQVVIAGGQGTGTGAGGNITFQISTPSGTGGSTANSENTVASISGTNGAALFQNSANSATAFQVQDAAGAPVLLVDTTSTSANGGTVNYLTYPGFESGSFTNASAGWIAVSPGTLTQNTNKIHTYNGLYSAKVVTTASNGGLTTSSFNSTAGAGTYLVSFYAKVDPSSANIASNGFTVTATPGNGTTNICSPASGTTINSSGFQRLYCSVVTNGNMTALQIAQNDGTARAAGIYIDAVQLQPNSFNGTTITIPTPYQIGGIQLRGVIQNPLIILPNGDSANVFEVQTASGTNTLLNVDTVNDIVSLGSTGSQALASTVNIANTTGAATQTVNIGATNSASNAVLIQGGTGASAIGLQVGASGTIKIGTTSQTSTLNLGNTSASATTLINGGTGASAISLQAGAGGTILVGTSGSTANATTVDIANTTGAATQIVNIGATNSAANTVLIQGGTGASAIGIQVGASGTISVGTTSQTSTLNLGNISASATTLIQGGTSATAVSIQEGTAGTVSIGTTNAGNVSIGATGSTANATTVNIANSTGAVIQTVNIGSLTSTSATTIQGGTGASAVSIQSGASGTILLGTTAQNSTIQIGTSATNTGNTQTINVGNTSAAGTTNVTVGSTVAGTVTLQGATVKQAITGGSDTIQSVTTNNTAAFQVQNTSAASLLTADTSNLRLGVDVTYAQMSAPSPTAAIPTQSATPTVTPTGATGSTTYHYIIVATGITAAPFGSSAASVAGATTTGNATLSPVNYNALSWTAYSNATGYYVYRSTGGTLGYIGYTTTNSFSDTGLSATGSVPTVGGGLTASSVYRYKVTAIDSTGGETTPGTEVNATTGVASTTDAITLSWTKVTGAIGYRIYRTAAGGATNTETFLTSVTGAQSSTTVSYTDSGTIATLAGFTVPAANTAYAATNVTNTNNLELSVGGNGTPTGQVYVSGTVPAAAVSTTATVGAIHSVYVQGNYAYVANSGNNNLGIYDVSNPASPSLIGSVATGTTPYSVYVQGRYAYVANYGNATFGIYDVSNPASPVAVSSVATGTSPDSVYVSGRYAYVANNGSNSLQVFDVSNPASPVAVSSVATGTSPDSVYVSGRYAYVANNGSNSLQVFDVSNPASPSLIGSVAAGSNPVSVYIQGRYAYVGSGSGTGIYDVSNPASPAQVGNLTTGVSPVYVYVQGRYAYVTLSSGNLQIDDVSNPSLPVQVGTVATGSTPVSVYVLGRYAYVANSGAQTLQIFDLGGTYTQQLQAGGAEVGTLQVDSNATVSGNASIQGGLNIGAGLQVAGAVGVNGSLNLTAGTSLSSPSTPTLVGSNANGTLSNATHYYYKIAAVSGSSMTNAVASSPTNYLTTTATSSTTLTWSAVTGATGYIVYRSTDGATWFSNDVNSSTLGIFDNGSNYTWTNAASPLTTTNNGGNLIVGGSIQGMSTTGTNIAGSNLNISGGQGTGTGNGGNIVFQVAAPSTTGSTQNGLTTVATISGVNGAATFENSTNSTTALQVQNASAAALLTADTTNMRLGVDATYASMSVPGGLSVGTATIGGSLTASTTYYYEVTAIDSAGGETTASTQASGATTSPNKTLPVTWTTVTGASAYRVYRSTTSGAEVYLTTVLTNSFTDTGSFTAGTATPPASNSAYISTNTATNDLELSVGGNGTPTGQVYVSGTVPTKAIGSASTGSNTPNAVDVVGNYAYVLGNADLQVYDISNSADPVLVSTTADSGNGYELYVQGHYAYIGGNGSATQIFNVYNPYAPVLVSTLGTASGIYVEGSYMYVLQSSYGYGYVQIYNIANPAAPQLISQTAPITGIIGWNQPNDLYAYQNYVYAYGNAGNVYIYDVSNPSAPVLESSTNMGNYINGLYVQGSDVYVAANAAISAYNISNPASPTYVGGTPLFGALNGYNNSLIVNGRYAYVLNAGNPYMVTVDVSNPASEQVVGAVSIGAIVNGTAESMSVSGNHAYVVSGTMLQVFDLGGTYTQTLQAGNTETGNLQVDSNANISGTENIQGGLSVGQSIQAAGNLGISGGATIVGSMNLSGGNNALSSPSAPTITPEGTGGSTTYTYTITATNASGGETIASASGSTTGGNATLTSTNYNQITWSAVTGATAYNIYRTVGGGSTGLIGSTTSLSFNDIGLVAPGNTSPTINTTNQLTVQGSVLFHNSTNSTTAFQVQNAAGAAILTADTTNNRIDIGSIGTSAEQLYVSGSIPTAVTGTVATSASPWGLYVQNSYAYVINSTTSFQIINESNPASPAVISTTAIPGSAGLNSIYVLGQYAYIVDAGTTKMFIYNISNPNSPTLVSTTTTANYNYGILVSGNYAYLTSSASYIQVLNISNPALPVSVSNTNLSLSDLGGMTISGNYIYLVANGYLKAINISNPASPSVASTSSDQIVSSSAEVSYVMTSGGYAYVYYQGTVWVYNIANPASIGAHLASATSGIGGSSGNAALPYEFYIQGKYAYGTDYTNGDVFVFNIASPTSPSYVGDITGMTNPNGLFVQGNDLYVLDFGTSHLLTYDLGGEYAQQLSAGGIETSTLQVDNNANVAGTLTVDSGLNVSGASELNGDFAINGNATIVSQANSTTALRVQNAGGTTLLDVDTTNTQSTFIGDVNVGTTYGSRLFSDGFESGNFNLEGGAISSGTSTAVITTSPVHTGKYAATFTESGSGAAYLTTPITTGTTTTIRGYAYVSTASPSTGDSFFSIGTTTGNFDTVGQFTNGDFGFYNNTAGAAYDSGKAIATGTWHEYEADVVWGSGTSGSVVLYMDGVQVYSSGGVNTGTTLPTNLHIGDAVTGHTGTYTVDDISVGTSYLGEAADLNVGDSLHVGGTSSFNAPVLVQTASNSATAFQVQDASSDTVLDVNTITNAVNLGDADNNVAYANHQAVTPATGTTVTSPSFSVSGSNPVLIINVALDSTTATVSSVSWSHGGGTAYQVSSVRNGTSYVSIWAIPAPVAGSGTFTVNLSASVAYQVDAQVFDNVNQTTPAPTGDAVNTTGTGAGIYSLTVTPANVGGNDAEVAAAANSGTCGDADGIEPENTYNDLTTNVNLSSGFQLGPGAITSLYGNPCSGMVAAMLAIHLVGVSTPTGNSIVSVNSANSSDALQVKDDTNNNVLGVNTVTHTLSVTAAATSLILGSSNLVNNTFNNTSYWTTTDTSHWTLTSSTAQYNGTIGDTTLTNHQFTTYYDQTYQYSFTLSGVTGGACVAFITGNSWSQCYGSNGTFTGWGTSPANGENVWFDVEATGSITISNVSVELVENGDGAALMTQPALTVQNSTGQAVLQVYASSQDPSSLNIGYEAGANDINGYANTALGYQALWQGAMNENNTAVGYQALAYASQAFLDTAVGYQALISNSTGGDDVAMGTFALGSNSNGNQNVAIGDYALDANTDPDDDTAIGWDTGVSSSGDSWDRTALGAYSYVSEDEALVLGCVLGTNSCPATTEVGVGTTAPVATFNVVGNDVFEAASNSSSTLQVQNATGHAILTVNTSGTNPAGGTGYSDVIIGSSANTGSALDFDYSGTPEWEVGTDGGDSTNNYGAGGFYIFNDVNLATDLGISATGAVDLRNSTNSTTALQVQSSGGSTNVLTVDTTNKQVSLNLTATTNTHALCRSGTTFAAGTYTIEGCSGTITADYAELYPTDGSVSAADIVMPDGNYVTSESGKYQLPELTDTTSDYASNAMGVISQQTLADNNGDYTLSGNDVADGNDPMALALNGRVLTKVNTQNGAIEPGDYITASSTPGVGMKATQAGQVVGQALAAYNGSGTGEILILVNPSYYPGPSAASYIQNGGDAVLNGLTVSGTADFADLNASGPSTLASLTVTGDAGIGGNLTVGGGLTVTGLTSVADIQINGHIITAGSAPTVAVQTGAGSGASVSISGDDTTGTITITTGSASLSAGDLAQIIFSKTYAQAPHIVLSPSNDAASTLNYFKGTTSATDFMFDTHAPPAANTTYQFDYFIAQ